MYNTSDPKLYISKSAKSRIDPLSLFPNYICQYHNDMLKLCVVHESSKVFYTKKIFLIAKNS